MHCGFTVRLTRKHFTRIISFLWWFGACKISTIYSNGNIFKFGVECRKVGKMCVFNRQLAISQKWWDIWQIFLLSTNRKSHRPFHVTRKSFAGFPTPAYGRPSLAKAGLLVHCVMAPKHWYESCVILGTLLTSRLVSFIFRIVCSATHHCSRKLWKRYLLLDDCGSVSVPLSVMCCDRRVDCFSRRNGRHHWCHDSHHWHRLH